MSHYKWLDVHLPTFFKKVGLDPASCSGLITANGDKCYSKEGFFIANGIHFYHGVAIYLLTSMNPFANEVRQTEQGWVDPFQWIIDNKDRFIPLLPEVN